VDIQQAGKCLAFEMCTATGFHALRALESVMCEYLRLRDITPTKRDMGEYVRLLVGDGADQGVIAIIDQLRKLYRNPLMHPEDNLETTDEAIGVFQLSTTAIGGLIRDMEKRKLFPS